MYEKTSVHKIRNVDNLVKMKELGLDKRRIIVYTT